jgi:hypothetical protein
MLPRLMIGARAACSDGAPNAGSWRKALPGHGRQIRHARERRAVRSIVSIPAAT